MSAPSFSFEFFPPKTPKAAESLWTNMQALAHLQPKYMTVTYGAGGSTRDGTLKTLKHAVKEFTIPMASHLTFLSTTKADLNNYIDTLWTNNIKHIIALRGDLPEGTQYSDFNGPEYYKFTSEFVSALLERYNFEISVGAYPEKHPDAPSLEDDIEALRLKCEAGATRAITQFFFDNSVYYSFLEKTGKAGIKTPICPGILPVHNFKSMLSFAKKCETHIPNWLQEKFSDLDDKPEEAQKLATDILIKQVEDLVANGCEHIHFYTLNKATITTDACEVIKTL